MEFIASTSSLSLLRYKDGVSAPATDGYTKNEKTHELGKVADIQKELQTLHPYVTKSLKGKDQFYAEQMYAHKQRKVVEVR